MQDLLSSGALPSVKEDEYFSEALRTFGNPTSNRYPLLISHIFARAWPWSPLSTHKLPTDSLSFSLAETPEAVSDFTFDDPDANPKEHRVYEALVKDRLIDLFRRHGAIEYVYPSSALPPSHS